MQGQYEIKTKFNKIKDNFNICPYIHLPYKQT